MVKTVAVLFLATISGCAALRGASFSATAHGQTISGSIGEDGTVCTSYNPPLTYYGESCSMICVSSTAPFVDLTCTAASTNSLHKVRLMRASP